MFDRVEVPPLSWFLFGFVTGWVSMGFLAMYLMAKEALRRAKQ